MTMKPVNIERLHLITENDLALERELIALFLDDTSIRVAHIETARQTSDANVLSAEAHALKGASANMGAEVLQRSCADLEKLARELQRNSSPALWEQADSLVRQVVADYHEASHFFRQHIASLESRG